MSDKKQTTIYGTSLSTVLFIIFLVLKLTNNITWSWIWVFSPYWIPLAFFILLVIIILLASFLYLAHTGRSIDNIVKKYIK